MLIYGFIHDVSTPLGLQAYRIKRTESSILVSIKRDSLFRLEVKRLPSQAASSLKRESLVQYLLYA